MNVLLVGLLQAMIIIGIVGLLPRRRIGFYTCFYGAMLLLIILPSHLIYADTQGAIELSDTFGREADAKVQLSLGNGTRPMAVLMIFQVMYLLAGFVWPATVPAGRGAGYRFDVGGYARFAVIVFMAGLAYNVVRYWYVPDYPLFRALASGDLQNLVLRDISYEYASNHEVPYIFLPSINAQFYRIMMPCAALMLVALGAARQDLRIRAWGLVLMAVSLVLIVGSFKRMPIGYTLLWLFFYRYMFETWKGVRKVALYFWGTFGITLGITLFYSSQSTFGSALLNLSWRAFLGEAVGQWLALEHYGRTFDYMYFDLVLNYLRKVLGQDVMTFSEMWKAQTGGHRGYTSVGMVVETFVSFGPWLSVPFFAAIPALMLALDRYFADLADNAALRPVIAGLLVTVGFMSVKGFASQMFAGGTMTLLAIFGYLMYSSYEADAERAASSSRPGAAALRLAPR